MRRRDSVYERMIAFLKHVHGVRNVAITHMQWRHIDFVRTNFRCNETQTDEVRPSRQRPSV